MGMRSEPCIEYEIYVPTVDRAGKPFARREVQAVRRQLIAYFGGLTDTRQRNEGIWKVGGVQVRDEIVIWKVLSERGAQGDRRISQVQARLEKLLRQKRILIVRRAVETMISARTRGRR